MALLIRIVFPAIESVNNIGADQIRVKDFGTFCAQVAYGTEGLTLVLRGETYHYIACRLPLLS